jgi:hypothetical protein
MEDIDMRLETNKSKKKKGKISKKEFILYELLHVILEW